jgi:hypothetical protein
MHNAPTREKAQVVAYRNKPKNHARKHPPTNPNHNTQKTPHLKNQTRGNLYKKTKGIKCTPKLTKGGTTTIPHTAKRKKEPPTA